MLDNGIYVRGVWKKFRRGSDVDVLTDLLASMLRRSRPGDELAKQEFWAVRDLSFEVRPGEAVGIIGHNGAGKSTVLKLLTRILRPNKGTCELRGRVGSLIEISAAFHQDLTGRENVFLQGAVMGMKRDEIRRRFDDIVEFSGISEFIDTPVRRYSSGMNARLGFSIAAHLDAEVLVIDEVLSVGDYSFQQRAFDRLQEMVQRNAAAVLVTHQLHRISSLCQRAILLRRGAVVHDGTPEETIAAYINERGEAVGTEHGSPMTIDEVQLVGPDAVKPGGQVVVRVSGRVLDGGALDDTSGVGITIQSLQNAQHVFGTSTALLGIDLPRSGEFHLQVVLEMNVEPGVYNVRTGVFDRKRGQPIARGPHVAVLVQPDFSFKGRTYLRPSMQLLAPHECASSGSLSS